ncbi:MAG TPA: maleylpyruvate isomerase N-terminal domain-containing protein [Micromonosporaceae bacterium]
MARLRGTKDFWMAALRVEGTAFRTAVAAADPQAPVLSCPGWTTTRLVHHLGSIYDWVLGILAAPPDRRPEPPRVPEGLPTSAAAIDWWQERYDRLMGRLDDIDPDAPAWNWAPQPKRAAFWHRRMAHESAVHRWDAQAALSAATPIEAKLAADGIGEVLDSWLPAGRRRSSSPRYGVVHLVATDCAQEWFVRLRGAGMALLDTATILDDDRHPRARASGTASDLLLALWGRLDLDALELGGDVALLDALQPG